MDWDKLGMHEISMTLTPDNDEIIRNQIYTILYFGFYEDAKIGSDGWYE